MLFLACSTTVGASAPRKEILVIYVIGLNMEIAVVYTMKKIIQNMKYS